MLYLKTLIKSRNFLYLAIVFSILLMFIAKLPIRAYISLDDRLPHFVPITSQLIANSNGNLRFTVWKGSTGVNHDLTIIVNGEERGTYPRISTLDANSGPHLINTNINVNEGDVIDIKVENFSGDGNGYSTYNYSEILNQTNQNPTKMTLISKPYVYADGVTYCGRDRGGNFDVKIDITDWMGIYANKLLDFLCLEDSTDWDHNDLMIRIDFVPDNVNSIDTSCVIPDTQNNPNSTSCTDVVRPLIQYNPGSPETLKNDMKGIDPTTRIKFDWADSVPNDEVACTAYYELRVWEVDNAGNKSQFIIYFATSNSEYTLEDSRLDFSKDYIWQVTSNITHINENLCFERNLVSPEYHFSSNSLPVYLQSGVAYNNTDILDNPVNGNNPAVGTLSKCDGNVNCTVLSTNQNGSWGGQNCYSGNPIYTDTQAPNGTKRTPDNPITFWFEYIDEENFLSDGCLQNEMQLHRLALIKKDVIDSPNFKSANTTLQISQMLDNNEIDGFYFDFDVSGTDQRKNRAFENNKATIEAYRFLDVQHRMRIVYEIEFKEGINSGEYEIFGSIVGTAFDPRGEVMYTSVLLHDIPADIDNTEFDNIPYFVEEPECEVPAPTNINPEDQPPIEP